MPSGSGGASDGRPAPFSHLERLCHEGARKRYQPMTPAVVKQLAHELEVVERTGNVGTQIDARLRIGRGQTIDRRSSLARHKLDGEMLPCAFVAALQVDQAVATVDAAGLDVEPVLFVEPRDAGFAGETPGCGFAGQRRAQGQTVHRYRRDIDAKWER